MCSKARKSEWYRVCQTKSSINTKTLKGSHSAERTNNNETRKKEKKTPEDNSRVCTQIKWIEHAQNIGMRPWTTNVYTHIHQYRRHTYIHKHTHTQKGTSSRIRIDNLQTSSNAIFSTPHGILLPFTQQNVLSSMFFFSLYSLEFSPRIFFPLSKSDCMQNILSFIFSTLVLSFYFFFLFSYTFPMFILSIFLLVGSREISNLKQIPQ